MSLNSLSFNPISYDTPTVYQSSGKQTQVNNQAWITEIGEIFPKYEDSVEQLTKVRHWIKKTFTLEGNKGATIGMLTADELYKSRVWHGCHDIAHIFAATIRLIGYPCVLVETTSVVWAKAYANNKNQEADFQGHNLTEVYLQGKWILFDPMSPFYLEKYNYSDPHIPIYTTYLDEPEGFYVMAKGKDCWDYGIRGLEDLHNLQKSTAFKYFKL